MSVIYKISCKDLIVKQCYFGSTKNLIKREIKHKHACNNEKNKRHYNVPLYKFIRSNGGWENWTMHVIDSITSKDKEIYVKCEGTYVKENVDIALNGRIPGRSWEDYKKDNHELIRKKANQKVACNICKLMVTRSNLSRHKKINKKCINLSQQ